jgi:ATP-dependent DNA ligase
MNGRFPSLSLPVQPPIEPMEGYPVDDLPANKGWQYEPKWDGFRCLVFREGRTVALQSKTGEPLTRYFPEVVMAASSLPHDRFVLDGELVVIGEGRLSWEDLVQRIHPSARKVAQLSAKSPATLLVFDLLAEGDTSLVERPLSERRRRLERFFADVDTPGVQLSPATQKRTEALGWLKKLEGAGIDGVVAKRTTEPYLGGRRDAMVKLRPERTADCVVGGFRRAGDGEGVASLLLGLFDEEGRLHFVGSASGFSPTVRKGLLKVLEPLIAAPGFTGITPSAESRITHGKMRDWEPLRPELVCEVRYDHFSGGRFRQVTDFVRWRPDKAAEQSTFDQVRPPPARGLEQLIGL